MKYIYSIILMVLSLSLKAQQKPNILVIIVDDAGYADFGFQHKMASDKGWTLFSPDIYDASNSFSLTPNLDALAASGTVFSKGYVTNSVCATSRAGLLTGRYQNRFGYEYNLVKTQYALTPGRTMDQAGILASEVTMADVLSAEGYDTSCIGKWHVGSEDVHHPNNRGFQNFYGLIEGSREYFGGDYRAGKYLQLNGVSVESELSDTDYITDVFTDKAITFIDASNASGKPFFQYLSYTTPHGPYQAKQSDIDAMDGVDEDPLNQGWGSASVRKNYLAMQKSLDDNIGELMNYLNSTPQKDSNGNDILGTSLNDNTIIFFLSDNGGTNKKGPINSPLRGFKSNEWEGGLRVPFFVKWPDGVNGLPNNNKKGGYYDQQIIATDIMASAIEAAGIEQSSLTNPLDGESVFQHIVDDSQTHEYLFWRKLDSWAVVANNDGYKLVLDYNTYEKDDDSYYLYKLNDDIEENASLLLNLSNNEVQLTDQSFDTNITQNLMQAFNAWQSELPLPNWIGKYILEGAYPCTFTNGMDLNTCSAVKARYEGAGNLVYDMDFNVVLDAKCFYVDDENAEKYGDAAIATNLVSCDNASTGFIMKKMQNANSYVEFTDVQVEEGSSYSLDFRYYSQATQTDKTVTILVNGTPFLENTVLDPGYGWCYESGSKVAVQTYENLPLQSNQPNTIRIINDISYEGICVKTTSALSHHLNNLKSVKVYPTFVDRDIQNYITIAMPDSNSDSFSVEVMDYSGRLLSTDKFNTQSKVNILLDQFSKGLHYIKVKQKGTVQSFKVILK
jgi:arylsulfatase A-like enzyme